MNRSAETQQASNAAVRERVYRSGGGMSQAQRQPQPVRHAGHSAHPLACPVGWSAGAPRADNGVRFSRELGSSRFGLDAAGPLRPGHGRGSIPACRTQSIASRSVCIISADPVNRFSGNVVCVSMSE